MDQSLISVIVPVYKVEPYLDRCVQSIVDQTYTNLEIILVDDGSPDNCPAMCDAWAEKDSRIKVIHKENGGLSDARNVGMAVATGEYLCFVDSDDWIHSEYVNLLHSACMKHHAEISACDVQLSYEGDVIAEVSSIPESFAYTSEQAIRSLTQGVGFRAVAWNKLFRRALLDDESFPVGRFHEDEFFTYRILAKASLLAYVDCPLYFYFQRFGSIMRSVSIRHLDTLDAGLERLAFLKENYPRLYPSDKISFCIACVSFYRQVDGTAIQNLSAYKARIKKCRSAVHFSPKELCTCSFRELIYIFGSSWNIDLFCKLLNSRKKLCQ